jgi:DNA polymerase I-like protein with 3'-5' exonuclease and polymerase domains
MDALITGKWKNTIMRIVLDIETNLAHDKIHVVVTKNIDTGEVNLWKQADSLREYLKDVSLIVMHNGIVFDAPVLNRLWKTKIRLNQVYDTLIVSRLLEPSRETGHSLEAWGNTLGFHKIDYAAVWQWMMDRKEEYKNECFDYPIDNLLTDYCIRDVEVTAKLYSHLVSELEQKQFSQESVDLEHRVAAIISEQTKNGFRLDQPYAICLTTTLKARLAALLERSAELYPEQTVERYSDKTGKRLKDSIVVFNIGARQQVAKKLQELGWKPAKHTEKGSIIVDEAVLDEIIKEQKCKIEKSTKNNGG